MCKAKLFFKFFLCGLCILALIHSTVLAQVAESSHLVNIRQLTFGGDNAEGYFSFNGKEIAFQSNNPAWGLKCDQIFWMNIEEAAKDSTYKPHALSNGKGRTTCAYYLPGDQEILYASTHISGDPCPPPPAPRDDKKYLWQVFDSYDIFIADKNGKIKRQLTNQPGYDAEATVSPDGKKIVFTSTRSGDLELWTMDIDGKNLKQLTFDLGYDGGAFFSPDSKQIIFRASRPANETEKNEYISLLKEGLVAPTAMDLYVINADGTGLKKLTHLGKASWAPFFHPSGKKIIFSSNHHSSRGYDFQLYMINLDGSGLEQITTQSNFNSFPMFSPDGKYIVFGSNRNNHGTRDTNLFIAEWKD
jgi:Tol biopolymer transport system component